MFRPDRMDASDVIRALKAKTIYLNLATQFSTLKKGNPVSCASTINCVYNFSDFDTRQLFFEGRYDYALASTCVTCSTCTTFGYQ